MDQTSQADWGKLLNEAMRIKGFDSINSFFREQFSENVFPHAKWKKLFRVAKDNSTGGYTQLIGNHRVPVIVNSVVRDVRGNIITNQELRPLPRAWCRTVRSASRPTSAETSRTDAGQRVYP